MKTASQTCRSIRSRFLLVLITTASFAALNTLVSQAAADEPKNHTLFMGADFGVERGKDVLRVRNVAGEAFVVVVKGEEVRVPMTGDPVKLKIDQELKLTETAATISKLKSERSYTPGNSPRRKWLENRPVAPGEVSVGDVIDRRQDPITTPQATTRNNKNEIVDNLPYYSTRAKDGTAIARGLSGQDSAAENFSGMSEEFAQSLFDAIEVEFDVSSEKPLVSPYIIVVAQFHEKDKPKTKQNWIYAQALEPIYNTPTHVRFLKGGFPLGFELAKFSLHLYDNGTEVATNVAENRVQLTREEALDYIVLDYLGRHKGETLPSTPAMVKIPSDWDERVKKEEQGKTCFVKVDKGGRPVAAFADKSCSKKLSSAYVAQVVMDARFLPALEKGKAIDGIAQVKVADLGRFAR